MAKSGKWLVRRVTTTTEIVEVQASTRVQAKESGLAAFDGPDQFGVRIVTENHITAECLDRRCYIALR